MTVKNSCASSVTEILLSLFKKHCRGFPGSVVVDSLPVSTGDTGSSPGLGRSHMLRSH